jgi:hypothetical protein
MKKRIWFICLWCVLHCTVWAQGRANMPNDPNKVDLRVAPAAMNTLLFGSKDEKFLDDLFDFLVANDQKRGQKDIRNMSDEQWTQFYHQDHNTVMTLFNSYPHLDFHIYLDKAGRDYKRDLNGKVTLDDVKGGLQILFLNAQTRGNKSLEYFDALTYNLVLNRSNASRDPVPLRGALTEQVRRLLAEKSFALASDGSKTPRPDIWVISKYWDEGANSRSTGVPIKDILDSNKATLIVVHGIQMKPPEDVDILMIDELTPAPRKRKLELFDASSKALKEILASKRYEKLGELKLSDVYGATLKARQAGNEAFKKATERLKTAFDNKDHNLVGALQAVKKNTSFDKYGHLCSGKITNEQLFRGMLASKLFLNWSKYPASQVQDGFNKTIDNPDELYKAILDGRCIYVIDTAPNIQKYLNALEQDPGYSRAWFPVMNLEEAEEPYAMYLGFESLKDYQFARKSFGIVATPKHIAELKQLGVSNADELKVATTRMNSTGYSSSKEPTIFLMMTFLSDEMEAKKSGTTASKYREAENKRIAAANKQRGEVDEKINKCRNSCKVNLIDSCLPSNMKGCSLLYTDCVAACYKFNPY